jgi:conjugal transfer/entry exclusion protein
MTRPRSRTRALLLSTTMLTAPVLLSTTMVTPAYALFGIGDIVFDPSNYAENVLSAARALEQINN